MKRNKTITEKDIYHFYPYRKNPIIIGKTIPQPYVKKENISDHKYAMTYDLWISIVKDYFLEVRDVTLKGKLFTIPKFLGSWQLKKYKAYRRVDWGTTKRTGVKTYYRDSDNYRILMKWYRTPKNSSFKFKNHWKISICKGFGKAIYDKITNDSNYVYTIIDT